MEDWAFSMKISSLSGPVLAKHLHLFKNLTELALSEVYNTFLWEIDGKRSLMATESTVEKSRK